MTRIYHDLFCTGSRNRIHSFSSFGALLVLVAGSAVPASAQAPSISANGVVNGASFTTTLVAGSAASIFGTNLSTSTANFGGIQPIPTTLGGATVTAGGYTAHIYYASPTQVNFQVPWEVAGQTSIQVTVTTSAGTSNAVTPSIAPYSPALFFTCGQGQNQPCPGSIYNANGQPNSSTNAANPGSVVVLTATNLGPAQIQQTDGNAPNNNAAPLANAVSVTIGGSSAPVVLAELCGGLQYCPLPNSTYLIYVQVPNIASNAAAPVVLTEGSSNSNTVTMNVAAQALTINSGPNFGDFQMGPVQIPLQASGGAGGPYTWSVVAGSTPNDLAVRNDGGPNYFPIGITSGILGVATTPGTSSFTLQVADAANNTATLACTITILSLAITNPNQLADGLKGALYSYQMTSSGATGAVTWGVPNNNLPAGLSLNTATGVISGSPSANGNFGFNISATDSTGTTTRFYNIQVFGVGFATNGDLGIHNQGSAVNITLTGTGGTTPYTFSAAGLPPGLSLNSTTGVISGTIAGGNGSYRFNASITDHNGNFYNKKFVLNIVSVPGPPSLSYPNPIEYPTVGESRNFPLNVNGGTPPYQWTVTNGTLPPGMVLLTGNQLPSNFNVGPNDAVITGVPTAAPANNGTEQTYTFTVNVKDSSPTPITVSQPITLTVVPFDIDYPPNPIRGVPYSGYVQPYGAVPRVPQGVVTWTILEGTLPPGLTLSPITNMNGGGYITGTPTADGNYTVFMDVNCCAGLNHVQRYISFNTQSPTTPPISFNNLPSLPDGALNANYNYFVGACCAPNGVTFSVVGSLPSGLNLNPNGQLSGTPHSAGQYTVTLKATDNNNANNFGIGIYSLNITPFQVSTPTPTGTVGTPYSTTFTVTSGNSGTVTWGPLGQGSQLPPGLTWSNGTLSGNPTTPGNFNMNVVVSDAGGNSYRVGFSVNIYPSGVPPAPSFNFGPNFGSWPVGEIQFALNASGGNGTYTWSIANGSLPPGLAIRTDPPLPSYFNGATAGISGVATTPGNYAFTLAVTSGGQTSYLYCTWRITGLNAMDSGWLPQAFVNVPYSYTFTPVNNAGAVTFSQNGGTLPPGLTFSSGGTISGTPTQAGGFSINYLVSDGTDTIGRGTTINVAAVHFTGSPILGNFPTNTTVSLSISATGGTGGYTYTPGGLPCCLSLSPSGALSGTLAGVGNFGFSVTATDSSSESYTQQFSITAIGDPPQLPSINLGPLANDPVAFVGGYMSWIVGVNGGGAGPFTWTVTGLPAGVSYRPYNASELTYMTPGNVEIWGTPTSAGSYPVTYKVTDANGLTASVTSTLTISPIMVDYSNYPPNGTVGSAYSDKIRVLGGTGPYTISQAGTQLSPLDNPLPDGLTLSTSNFTISGTPLESGYFNPNFKVQDSTGNSYVLLTGFNIATTTSPTININNYYYLGTAIIGSQYNQNLNSCCTASGQFTYTLAGGSLPPGLNLAANGAITGTATTHGTYTFLVKSADSTNSSNAGYKQFVITASALNLTASTTLPYGNVGTQYNNSPGGYQIPTSGGSGTVTFTLGPQGPLPPGISLSSSGVLSGTPSASGQYQFNALIKDTAGDVLVAYFSLSVYTAGSGPAVGITTGANLGTVAIGVVQIPLTAAGGTGSYSWSITGGSLPPGLSLRTDLPGFFPPGASAGIIGVATAASATPYSFTLKVTSGTQSLSQTFTLKVTGLTVMENYGLRLPDAFVSSGYSYTLTPLQNAGAVTFSNPNNLPPGMTLSSAGVLSGTPSSGGFFNFSFTINDTVDTVGFSASISVNAVQVTSPAVLTNATQGQPYTFTPTASGGSGGYSYTINGYPNGLTLNNGVLSGTVTGGPGRYVLNVTATDSTHESYNKQIALDVIGIPFTEPSILPYGNLDDCSYGVACSRGIGVTSGGTAPFTWTVTGLPNGMHYRTGAGTVSSNIAPTDLELWGAPLQTGTFNITVKVTDSSVPAVSASQTFPLRISKLWPDGSYNLVNGTLGAPYSRQMRVLGGTPAATAPLYSAGLPPLELPAGLTLNGMTVSGTPQENGNFSPDFTFTDTSSNTLHVTWYFNIADSGTSTINLNSYSFGNVGGSTNDVIGYYAQGSGIGFQLNACCAPSYTFTQTGGNLPPGVSLSSNGFLTGTISASAAVGPYTFTVQAADAGNSSNTGQRQYTIYVTSFNLTAAFNLPYGTLNVAYPNPQTPTVQLQATNSVSATFALMPGSVLPPGLSLSAGGLISGTPSAIGQYFFWVSATNNGNANDIYIAQYNISIWTTYPPLFLGVGPTLGPLSPGAANFQLTASGGVPPYHYSFTPAAVVPPNYRVQDGGQLPEGFQLNQGTGGLIGIVEGPGTYQTSIRVTDSATTPNVFDRPVTMIFSSLTIPNANNPPGAYQGTPYSFTFAGTGGTPPYNWTVTGLPAGITLTGSTISGTPSTSGAFFINVTVKDTTGTAENFGYTLNVMPFNITTGPVLSQGTIGQAYSQQLSAPNCVSCVWSIAGGSLPSGLSLNSSTGVISGTPNGFYNNWFTVQAKSNSATALKTFSIPIAPGTPQPLFITNNPNLYTSPIGNPYSTALFAQGGTPPYTWSLSSGSLPAGMSLMASGETLGYNFGPGFTYLIGRPLQLGAYSFTLKVTDSAQKTATEAFTWNITPLSINTGLLPANGNSATYAGTPNPMQVPTYGVGYSQQIEVIGGTGTYTSWTTPLAGNPLPAGLTINQTTGVVSGTPGETGSYSTLFQATDTAGNTLEQFVTFNIAAGSSSTVNIGAGPNLGTWSSGNNVVFNLNPSGGTAPYSFSVLDSLPPGCALESGNQLLGNANGSYDLACIPLSTGTFPFTLKVTDSANNYGVKVMSLTFSPLTLFTNVSLGNGSAGTSYSEQLLTWDNTGNFTWSVAPYSALPPGMTLNGATLSGTPSTAGNYNFTLIGTDTTTGETVSSNFNISISTITITNPSVIPVHAVHLAPYSYQLNATGGGGSRTWSANNLPSGLSIGSATGLISGIPQGSGSYRVTVTVTDGSSTLNRNFSLFVDYPELLTIPPQTTSLPDVRVGQSYAITMNLEGGVGPYTWSVPQGSSLPAGLSLYSGSSLPPSFNPGATIIAGAPTTAKQYTFDLVVTDSSSPKNSVRATYTLNVTPIGIEPGGLPNGTINAAYSRQITAAGGTPPYTFTTSAASLDPPVLPEGLSVSPSGLISGTPTSTGSYSFRVTVTDNASHTYTNSYSLTITNASGLFVDGSAPYNWTAGVGLYGPLQTNGNSTYTWSVQAGALAPGMTLDPTGAVSGAVSAAGTYNVTLRATDNSNSGNFADKQFALVISPMQLEFAAAAPPAGTVGTAYSFQYVMAGGTAPYTFTTTPLFPLPPGLSISSSGLISGTPTQGGTFRIYAMVTDHAGKTGWAIDSGFDILNPGQKPPIRSLSIHTHNGTVGVPFAVSSGSYSYPLDGTFAWGGVPPISYTAASGSSLPPGLHVVPAANGVPAYLAGVPTTAGQYSYALTATDSAGQTATVQLYTVIAPIGALPSVLPNGVVGTPYSAAISAFGGAPSYTYGIGRTTDGNGNFSHSDMPPGVSMSPQGVLSGTPTQAGIFNIVAYAQDSAATPNSVLLNYTVVIDSAGTAQGIGMTPSTPILLNYVLTSPTPAAVPVAAMTTSGSLDFGAMVSGIPGASLSATSGTAPASLNLSLNTTGLTAGTYSGVVGIASASSLNGGVGIPVVLTVTSPPPCVYSLVPTGGDIVAAGGSGGFTVSTGPTCSWTATTTDSFVTINPAFASGTGTGLVRYTLSANAGSSPRSGAISVNGSSFTITQFGSSCALALDPPSVVATAAGGLATVNVTVTSATCSWTASGLNANPASGTGSGAVTFNVLPTNNVNSQTLTATVQLSGGAASTFTVNQTGASCTAGLGAPGVEIGYQGGAGQVTVTTPNGCPYSTVNGPGWISVTSGASGNGPGTLFYSVAANSTTVSRSGTLNIAGVPYTITQDPAPCSVTVSPSGSPFDSGGGGGILAITANGANCSWTASSPATWLTLSSGSGGSTSINGSGTMNVTMTAASNAASTTSRGATLTVGGQSVAVTQGGTVCTYTLGSSNSSIPYAGGTGSVSVTAPDACHWSSNIDVTAPWLTINSSGTSGTANVVFVAAPNNTSTARSGTLTVAGQPFTVTEAAGPCSYILNSTNTALSAAGGAGLFTFSTATTNCPLQVNSFASWLKLGAITSSPDLTSGTVNFSADPNPSGATRSATIQFAGQSYTVSETGAACAYSLNSYGLALGQAGGGGNVYGSPTAQNCTPSVGTDQPTIVSLGTLGGPVGNIFTLPFTVSTYSSTVTGIRTMTISFGGQFFLIKQTSW